MNEQLQPQQSNAQSIPMLEAASGSPTSSAEDAPPNPQQQQQQQSAEEEDAQAPSPQAPEAAADSLPPQPQQAAVAAENAEEARAAADVVDDEFDAGEGDDDEADDAEGDEDQDVLYVEPRTYIGVTKSGEFGMQGLRSTMEDHTQVLQHPHFNEKFRLQDDFPRSFFAVYDGHGGSVCSEYCSRHVHNLMIRNKYMANDPKEALRCGLRLVERAFLAACRRIDIETSSGTTAICVYVEQDRLVCGNVGDSRAVLCTVEPRTHEDGSPLTEDESLLAMDDPNFRPKVIAVPLSIDHKPARDCERVRVESRGGQVATTAVEAKQVQQQHLKRRQRRLARESKARHSPSTRDARLQQLQSQQQQQQQLEQLRPGPPGSGKATGDQQQQQQQQQVVQARRRPRGRHTPREAKILRIAEEIDADRELAVRYGVDLDFEEGLGESRSFLDDQAEYSMQNYSAEDSFGGDSGLAACCSWCCSWLTSWTALDRPFRVFPGGLSVSRAIGDIGLKRDKLIVADAEMSERILTENDRFVILACDGVWDVMSSQAAADFVYQKLIVEGVSCHSAAAELAEEAYRMGSTDNISVVVVQLGWVREDASTDTLQDGNNPYYCAVSGEVMDGPGGQQGGQIVAVSSGTEQPGNRQRMPFASLSQAQAAALRIKVDEVVHHPPQVVPQRRNSADDQASPLDILLGEQGDADLVDGGDQDDYKENRAAAVQPQPVITSSTHQVMPGNAAEVNVLYQNAGAGGGGGGQ